MVHDPTDNQSFKNEIRSELQATNWNTIALQGQSSAGSQLRKIDSRANVELPNLALTDLDTSGKPADQAAPGSDYKHPFATDDRHTPGWYQAGANVYHRGEDGSIDEFNHLDKDKNIVSKIRKDPHCGYDWWLTKSSSPENSIPVTGADGKNPNIDTANGDVNYHIDAKYLNWFDKIPIVGGVDFYRKQDFTLGDGDPPDWILPMFRPFGTY